MKKFYFLILSILFFAGNSLGQTYTIPINGPGFDNGSTFADNGWTVVNSSANKWVVGTQTFNSSPNSAYISVDGDPSHYSYDNSSIHISHLYQKINVPANAFNIAFSFKLLGNIQNDQNGNLLDGLEVYVDPTLTAPTADALPGSTAYLVFPQWSQNTSYTDEGITLDLFDLAGKSFLLIFTWKNNGDNIGDEPPASVDDAKITYCLKSADFNVTGGGVYCTGTAGVNVKLSGSTVGINYQLYLGTTPIGTPLPGTGSELDFGAQKGVGLYTISGSSSCNAGNFTFPMKGSVTVSETPPPTPIAGNTGPLCIGATLNLTASGGITYSWTGPNGFSSTDQNPIINSFALVNAGTYTVSATSNGCTASATTNVTVSPGNALGGNINSLSVCKGDNGTLTLSGNSNTPDYWETTTDTISGSWTKIAKKTPLLNISNITAKTFYRAVITDGCSSANSYISTVGIHNLWTGSINTDWNNVNNWSDAKIPSTSCPTVVIQMVPSTKYPLLSTGTMAAINNLQIDGNASLTVNGNTMQIAGSILNNGQFDATAGTLEFNGTTPQTIAGNTFNTKTIQNLIVSNSSGLSISTTGDTLKISGTLSFGTANGKLNTGNNLTLLSTAAGTANVGAMSNTNFISGNVTVNRFINTGKVGNAHGKSWQMLATPTTGQSIRDSWMEGASASNVIAKGAGIAANPHPGYGTMTTSNVANAGNFPDPGFDVYTSPGPSIKIYNYVTNGYDGPPNTNIGVYSQHGYMILVRGDRSVYTYNQDANPTILRTTGTLFTPANPPPVITVKKDLFESMGNPYASAIDIGQIMKSGGVQDFFYVWDPKLAGAYGLGAFQTLGKGGDGNYYATPGGGSYPGICNTIESGQAFFVAAKNNDGTISFGENCKVNGSTLVLKSGNLSSEKIMELRANLFGIKDTAYIADGNLEQFNTAYSNKIDAMDARKMTNTSENFGIMSGGKNLSIERRNLIGENDTIFYSLSGLRLQAYKIEFIANGLSENDRQGFIEDTYLNKRDSLHPEGKTIVNFAVTNDKGSYASNRFRIVFAPLPMTKIDVPSLDLAAHQQDENIFIKWKIKNEKEIEYYEVQSSENGTNFIKIATIDVQKNASENYQWIDKKVASGMHYYRIIYIDKNGRKNYSKTANVMVKIEKPLIAIYPNPITDGIINLHFKNVENGRYRIRLLTATGQVIFAKQIEIAGATALEKITWNYYQAHGMYQLEITRPDGSLKLIKLVY